MSTFEPVISPWLAACSCVGFTLIFVGSLYIFPVQNNKHTRREHARHTLLASLSQSPPVAASASALAVVAAAASAATAATSTSNPNDETLPYSPRASSSSFASTSTFLSTGGATTTTTATITNSTNANNSNSITTIPTATTTSSIIMTKSPTVADNRAHRSSTHLQIVETSNTSPVGSLTLLSPSLSATATCTNTSSSSVSASASSIISSFSILEASGSACPEVAIHSYSQFEPYQSRQQRTLSTGSPTTRSTSSSAVDNQKLDRNHPLVILQRFKGIFLTCLIVPVYNWWLFKFTGAISTDQSFWTRLGYFFNLLGISFPENIFLLANHIVIPLVLVSVLFMGPILMMFLSNELPFQQTFDWRIQFRYFRGLIGIRNLVVSPISEEFIFRSCMVAVVAYSGATSYAMIFALPLVFGIAHLHYGYETFLMKGATRRAFFMAILLSFLQFVYTTLFGWFTTFLFLRTSNLIGPCLCHAFCNMMGPPDVTNIQYFGRWKNWLYLAFLSGVILFAVLLKPLTSPQLYGSQNSSAYWAITMGK